MSTFITKRRLFSLVSTSALVGTMAVAAVPASAMAASGSVAIRGETLTAKIVNPTSPVTGTINADGYDVAVYFGPGHSGTVDANISGAKWYGVVADRANVTVTGSQIHDIGDDPSFTGVQRGRAVLYINGAKGTISGNKVYDFQKNGIEISGQTADGSGDSDVTTSATVVSNVITGEGPIDYIAQNGIVVRNGATATVKNNIISRFRYTPAGTEATGLLNYNAGKITVSNNRILGTEVRIDGAVTANVVGHWTMSVRPNGVRVDLRSNAKPAAQAVLGTKLDWTIKVDGKVKLHIKQGFGDHAVYSDHFKTGSGRHVVKIYKNHHLVSTRIVRS